MIFSYKDSKKINDPDHRDPASIPDQIEIGREAANLGKEFQNILEKEAKGILDAYKNSDAETKQKKRPK